MEKQELLMDVMCQNEGEVVGHLSFTGMSGDVKISSLFIRTNFIPASDRYKIQSFSRGHMLECPRCKNILTISGVVKTRESEKTLVSDGVQIVVDRTVVKLKN